MGSGYRVFTAGEVLTASNVQNYLQDQAVMVFGGTAARSSAIGTANFEEGMLTYLTDVDKLQVYTGAAFADVYPAASSNQGLTLINTTSFSGVASQSVNDVFSATYDYYKLVLNVKGSTNNGMNLRLRVAGADNSTSNYKFGQLRFDFSANSNNQSSNGTTQFTITHTTTEFYGAQELTFYYPFKTERTTMSGTGTGLRSDFTSGTQMVISGFFDANTSFTGFTLIGNGGNITGDVSVYGFNK